MCGICGAIQIGGEPREVVSPPQLDVMTDVMTHRGPNDRGTYAAPGIALGVRDYRSSTSRVVTSRSSTRNGRSSRSRTASSTTTLISDASYGARDTFSRAAATPKSCRTCTSSTALASPSSSEESSESRSGMSADASAVLARDRMGVKPLYWARVGDLVVFASELKSILASGLVEPELDLEAVDLYFSLGFVPGPEDPSGRRPEARSGVVSW